MSYIVLNELLREAHGKFKKLKHGVGQYVRLHYGKQRLVTVTKRYKDRPTSSQKQSRSEFTLLRKEVARQIHDPVLGPIWEERFLNQTQYKLLQGFVYAELKKARNL